MTATAAHDQPPFMNKDLPAAMPGLDGLEVGSEILVVESSYDRRWVENPRPKRAVVTSKARVWIEAQPVDGEGRYRRSRRFRMDNQTDGSESHYATRFYTPDQWRYHQALGQATSYLKDQGIDIRWDSPWKGRAIELARVVWTSTDHGNDETKEG